MKLPRRITDSGQTSIEYLLLIGASVMFMIVVALVTRDIISSTGEDVDREGGLFPSAKEGFSSPGASLSIPSASLAVPSFVSPSVSLSPSVTASPSVSPSPTPSGCPAGTSSASFMICDYSFPYGEIAATGPNYVLTGYVVGMDSREASSANYK
ncbi:MAG: hypothetical protein ABH863_04790, partial [Candidatus Micrarchaeota archaeon]